MAVQVRKCPSCGLDTNHLSQDVVTVRILQCMKCFHIYREVINEPANTL